MTISAETKILAPRILYNLLDGVHYIKLAEKNAILTTFAYRKRHFERICCRNTLVLYRCQAKLIGQTKVGKALIQQRLSVST